MLNPQLAEIRDFFYHNRNWLIWLAGLSLVVYGFELFNLNLTPDEELYGASPTTVWLGNGRWMMWILNWALMPVSAIPVVPTAMALSGLAVSLVLALRMWGYEGGFLGILASAIGLTFPTLIFQFAFSVNAYGVGIGLICVVLGSKLAFEGGQRRMPLAIALFACSFGIYQALATVALVYLFAALLAVSLQFEGKMSLKELLTPFVRFILALGAGVFVYACITVVIWQFIDPEETKQAYASGHFSPSLLTELWHYRVLAETIVSSYAGTADFYLDFHWSLSILMLTSIAIIGSYLIRSTNSWRLLVAPVVLFLLLAISPFVIHFVAGNLPSRTLIALPFAAVAILATAMRLARGKIKSALVVMSFLVVLHNAALVNRLAFASEWALAVDQEVASAIVEEVHKLLAERSVDPATARLAIVGQLGRSPYGNALRHNIFGTSLFDFVGGEQARGAALLKLMGLSVSDVSDGNDLPRLIEAQRGMPSWPSIGSIELHDRLLVVKLSDFTRNQVRRACRSNPKLQFCEGAEAH